jgi:hypothetical protein
VERKGLGCWVSARSWLPPREDTGRAPTHAHPQPSHAQQQLECSCTACARCASGGWRRGAVQGTWGASRCWGRAPGARAPAAAPAAVLDLERECVLCETSTGARTHTAWGWKRPPLGWGGGVGGLTPSARCSATRNLAQDELHVVLLAHSPACAKRARRFTPGPAPPPLSSCRKKTRAPCARAGAAWVRIAPSGSVCIHTCKIHVRPPPPQDTLLPPCPRDVRTLTSPCSHHSTLTSAGWEHTARTASAEGVCGPTAVAAGNNTPPPPPSTYLLSSKERPRAFQPGGTGPSRSHTRHSCLLLKNVVDTWALAQAASASKSPTRRIHGGADGQTSQNAKRSPGCRLEPLPPPPDNLCGVHRHEQCGGAVEMLGLKDPPAPRRGRHLHHPVGCRCQPPAGPLAPPLT